MIYVHLYVHILSLNSLPSHHLGKAIKQKTTETLEKLASTKMNKEKNQLCHTGAQREATAATRYTCAHTHAHSLTGQL